jgi:hypothetical protein
LRGRSDELRYHGGFVTPLLLDERPFGNGIVLRRCQPISWCERTTGKCLQDSASGGQAVSEDYRERSGRGPSRLARRPRIHKFRSSQAPGHPVDQCSCSVLLRSSGSPRCRSIEAARQADLPPRRAVGAQSSSCPSTGDRLGRDCSDEPLAKRFAVTVEACLDDCDTKPECPRLPRSLEDELAVASRRSGYTVDVE